MQSFYFKRFAYMNNESDAAAAAAAKAAADAAAAKVGDERKFTQADFDKAMAKHKRDVQEQNKKLGEELETLRQAANLTEQQKADLEASTEALKSLHMTEAQKLSQESEKWKKKHEKDTATLGEETKQWRSRFETMMITNAILGGASQHKAVRAEQFVKMLSGEAKVVADVDADGKTTGVFSVKLPYKTIDPKTKESVIVDLPIAEAIAEMKKDETFFNLFEDEGKPGLGGSGNARTKTGGKEFSKGMSKDEFSNWFKKEVSDA